MVVVVAANYKPQKIEKFCQAILAENTQSAAYILTYPRAKKWKPATVHSRASEMANHSEVLGRLAELRAEIAERNAITVDDLVKEYEENRQAALTAETPQISAANGSTKGKAELLGMLTNNEQKQPESNAPAPVFNINIGNE